MSSVIFKFPEFILEVQLSLRLSLDKRKVKNKNYCTEALMETMNHKIL